MYSVDVACIILKDE